jgi:hypothetical protein
VFWHFLRRENYKNSKFAYVTDSWGIIDNEIRSQLN